MAGYGKADYGFVTKPEFFHLVFLSLKYYKLMLDHYSIKDRIWQKLYYFFPTGSALRKLSRFDNFPCRLNIELTNHCNLECVMCPNHTLHRPKGQMKFDLYKAIVDSASKGGAKVLGLGVFGEPLIYKRLPEAIRFASERRLECRISTNAALLTPILAEKLIDSGLKSIIFSIDGVTKENYEAIRIKGHYEDVVKNVCYYLDLCKKYPTKAPEIRLQTILMENTKDKDKEFIDFWRERTKDIPSAYFYVKEFTTFTGRVASRDPFKDNNALKILGFRAPCQHWDELTVYWDGTVGICCVDWEAELSLGSLDKSSLLEIWNSERMNRVRKAHYTGSLSQYPICNRCDETRKYPLLTIYKKLNKKEGVRF